MDSGPWRDPGVSLILPVMKTRLLSGPPPPSGCCGWLAAAPVASAAKRSIWDGSREKMEDEMKSDDPGSAGGFALESPLQFAGATMMSAGTQGAFVLISLMAKSTRGFSL